MQSRYVAAAFLCFVPTLVSSQAITRGETVCWGQHESNCNTGAGGMGPSAKADAPPAGFGPKTMFFGCDHGGPTRGFDGPHVCREICGSSDPSRCTIWTNEHGSKEGDACGYRWARVTCGTNPPAQALKRSETVCWGDLSPGFCKLNDYPRELPPAGFSPMTKHYPCGSGGHSGYNPAYVCQDLCGSSESFRCTGWTNQYGGKGGGACGMRWTRVACF